MSPKKSKKEEAEFILDFKKNQKRKFEQLLKARRLRLRSSVFDLPEFSEKPLVSLVILINTEEEWEKAEAFMEEITSNQEIQIAFLYLDGLTLREFGRDEVTCYKLNLQEENQAMWFNRMAVEMSGKIICLMTTIAGLDKEALFEMTEGIRTHGDNQIYLHDFQGKTTRIAMACDTFYLARGLDGLMEEVEISILDLALRVEILGSQVSASTWPMLEIPISAGKNVQKGRLIVNQESTIFDNFR